MMLFGSVAFVILSVLSSISPKGVGSAAQLLLIGVFLSSVISFLCVPIRLPALELQLRISIS